MLTTEVLQDSSTETDPLSVLAHLRRVCQRLFPGLIRDTAEELGVEMSDQDEWEDADDDVTMGGVPEEEVISETATPEEPVREERASQEDGPRTDEDIDPSSSWDRLPYELSHKILQILAEDEAKSHLMAEYAVVCRSWQAEIEKTTFGTLAVKQNDLPQLEEYVTGRRRALLRHIWLKVELPEYSRRSRHVPEAEAEQEENNFKYSIALYDLFKLLEPWNTPGFWSSRNGRGISLELSAFSPR